ncbi:MAG: PKD domain-containing protein [Chitinophagaceae bacterium]
MKKFVFLLVIIATFYSIAAHAHHIKGGWIGYKYLSSTSTTSSYQITVYLYVDCNNETSYTASVVLGAFDAATNVEYKEEEVLTTTNNILEKGTFSPCIVNAPEICYNVYQYTTTFALPNNTAGYNLNVQFRSRVEDIINIYNSDKTGISMFTTIPGTVTSGNTTVDAHTNSNPEFAFLDTSVVCYGSKISIPFSATDPDGDVLKYYFGAGKDASSTVNSALLTPAAPPYTDLTYVSPYTATSPLGASVTIDSTTGIISGTAPTTVGEYVIAVYAQEWRDGVLINTTKKELQINVTDCSLQSASLDPSYINCKDYTFTFTNNATTTNATYLWDFGVENDESDTSSAVSPTYTYADTGTYTLKLKVGTSAECTDSTTTEIKVYPGFVPDFEATGNCMLSPSQFTDLTVTGGNGTVNSWDWDFGDSGSSTEQNPSHQYTTAGDYKVLLQVGSDKGCSDTVSKTFTVFSTIDLQPLFTDTLICYKDSVQLIVNSPYAQTYQWTPSDASISDANVYNPIVYPTVNTAYTVTSTNGDCTGTATINVNLLKELTLVADDLYACIGDSATFNVSSLATKYNWTRTSGNDALDDSTSKQPSLLVSGYDAYHILATYGTHCSVENDVQVLAAPYPTLAIQTNDTAICLGNSVQLTATGNTTDDTWSPTNETGATITVSPTQTTSYIIDGYDRNSYCSKHVQDTVIVAVAPTFVIALTRDTNIVVNQPLVLQPTTNQPERTYTYLWSPSSYLSNTDSSVTVANIPKGITLQYYALYMTDTYGCKANAEITVHIFQTGTDIFVPTGFTPNNDGKNDVIRPILAGIKQFNYFKIFNRWGQLVYSTQTEGEGWNGNLNGQQQPSGSTYIYTVSGVDYNNKKIEKKGTIVLIR